MKIKYRAFTWEEFGYALRAYERGYNYWREVEEAWRMK